MQNDPRSRILLLLQLLLEQTDEHHYSTGADILRFWAFHGIHANRKNVYSDIQLLMDFGDLKRLLKDALADLDHRCLNEVPPFDATNPSSENLARHLWRRLAPCMPGGVSLVSVTVSEKPEQSATYSEE